MEVLPNAATAVRNKCEGGGRMWGVVGEAYVLIVFPFGLTELCLQISWMEDKRAPLIIKCSISAKSKLSTHLNATDGYWRRAGWPIRHIRFTSAALDSSETHEPLSCAGSWDLIPRMSCFAWKKRLAGDRQGRCNMEVGSSVCQTYMCCFVMRNKGLTIFFVRFGAISHSQIMSYLLFFFISSTSKLFLLSCFREQVLWRLPCILFLLQNHLTLTLSTVTLVWPAFSKHI